MPLTANVAMAACARLASACRRENRCPVTGRSAPTRRAGPSSEPSCSMDACARAGATARGDRGAGTVSPACAPGGVPRRGLSHRGRRALDDAGDLPPSAALGPHRVVRSRRSWRPWPACIRGRIRGAHLVLARHPSRGRRARARQTGCRGRRKSAGRRLDSSAGAGPSQPEMVTQRSYGRVAPHPHRSTPCCVRWETPQRTERGLDRRACSQTGP